MDSGVCPSTSHGAVEPMPSLKALRPSHLPRKCNRLLAIVGSCLLIWLLFYNFEPRRTAYSCRTFRSCIGIDHGHSYAHHAVPPARREAYESNTTLPDGTVKFIREAGFRRPPEHLILVLNKDATSWSSDFRSTQRSAADLLELLHGAFSTLETVSIAMMTSSVSEFNKMVEATSRYYLARTEVYLLPKADSEDQTIPYSSRHDPTVQYARRAALAKLRNQLMRLAPLPSNGVFWIDADVTEISPQLIQYILWNSLKKPDAGIITAPCHQNQMDNYDKNAWRLSPQQHRGTVSEEDREGAYSALVENRDMVPEIIAGSEDMESIKLDSVGGTLLYIRVELLRQGLVFPWWNVAGTTLGQDGWIGMETEGLCYLAKFLENGGCYVMGGSAFVRHTDWG